MQVILNYKSKRVSVFPLDAFRCSCKEAVKYHLDVSGSKQTSQNIIMHFMVRKWKA